VVPVRDYLGRQIVHMVAIRLLTAKLPQLPFAFGHLGC
jgi:hypothetical protein